jgi:hypothetical protein
MNRNDFTGFIAGSRLAAESDISGLKELTALYPWFHSAHLVLLRALKDASDVRFDTQLHESAMYVADRSVLYNYLYFSVPAAETEEPPKPLLAEVKEIAPVAVTEEPPKPVLAEVKEIAPATSTETNTRSREELIAEIESRLHDLASETVAAPQQSEQHINKEAVAEQVAEEIVEQADEPVAERPSFTAEENEEPQPEETVSVLELDPTVEYSSDSVHDSSEKIDAASGELLELDGEDGMVSLNEYVIEENVIQKEDQDALSQADLIDRFIKSNPRLDRMTPGKEEPVTDLSVDSTEVKATFITETLAKIYISQGYYSKAINIYEKLALQYPEKSAYFASRIEKIKDLIK